MTPRALLRFVRALPWASAALTLILLGCGGGVGTGGTGTYAAGPITGFGSVIVNDIRFDDNGAEVVDDDGAARQRSELRLGMTVEVDGGALASDTSGASARATRIRFGSEIVGPVQAVDRATGVLTVLGQTVTIAVDTVFDDRLGGGLAAVEAGQVLEIYAMYDAARAAYDATRIEPRAAAAEWRVRGPVAAVDPVTRTLRIGGANFFYGSAASVPQNLAVGRIVRLRIRTAPDAGGRFVVTAFGGAALQPPEECDEARLRGTVTALATVRDFQVNGLAVDASSAGFQPDAAGLRVGVRVEVIGATIGGTFRATSVKIETDDDFRNRGFELHGAIESVDAAARTFLLRGMTVGYARSDLRLDNGTLADIVAGRQVEVRAQPAPDRTRLDATRIKFE